MTPHKARRNDITLLIGVLIATCIILGAVSCTPSNGCHATRKMSGYK